jgi:FkbM family methyltransferase
MKKVLKFLYGLIPLKKHFFLILKYFWKPSPNIYQHLHFQGIFKVQVNGGSSFKMAHYGYQIENDVFWSGIAGNWEKHSLDIWSKLAKRADVILDIGANTGIYSLLAQSVNRQARIYAFEPVERVFQKLKKNIQLNGFQIECINKAVSDESGLALIYDDDAEHEYTASLQKINNRKIRSYETEVVSIDNFIDENSIQKIDLIKIDVEKHEPAVIRGFSRNIAAFKPAIIIEILNNEIAEEIETLLYKHGYNYYHIDEKVGAVRVNNIKAGEGFNYLMCDLNTANYLSLS